jgi:hypothetical protein
VSQPEPNEQQQDTPESQEPIEFGLSDEDLEAIAAARSKVVPDMPPVGNSAFTIENAPVAKSIMPAEYFMPPQQQLAPEPQAASEDDDEGDEPGQ